MSVVYSRSQVVIDANEPLIEDFVKILKHRPDVKWRLVSALIEEVCVQSSNSSSTAARDIVKQLQCEDSPVILALLVHDMIDGMFEEDALTARNSTNISLILSAAPQLTLLVLLAHKIDPRAISPEEIPSEEVVQAVLELHRF